MNFFPLQRRFYDIYDIAFNLNASAEESVHELSCAFERCYNKHELELRCGTRRTDGENVPLTVGELTSFFQPTESQPM